MMKRLYNFKKLIVTGSRVKRTQVAGALTPLIVITKEDIDASGFRNVTEALQSLPQGSAGNQGESEVNTFTPNANENRFKKSWTRKSFISNKRQKNC